jgi:hypothetical protein
MGTSGKRNGMKKIKPAVVNLPHNPKGKNQVARQDAKKRPDRMVRLTAGRFPDSPLAAMMLKHQKSG